MKRRVRFRARARAELVAAQAWYEGRQTGLGGQFAIAVDAAIEAVRRMPEAFPPITGSIRHVVMRRFPYAILYAIVDDDVVVLTFHHHRQDPAHRPGSA